MVYINGCPAVWPAKFLALLQGTWQVIEVEWKTSANGFPNAEEVMQVWRRSDRSLLIPVWRGFLTQSQDGDEVCWQQSSNLWKQQELSVGWVLDRLQLLGEEIEEENAGWFEAFIFFPDQDPTPNPSSV